MMEALLPRKGNDMAKENSFEKQMQKLQEIVEKLEKDEVDLAESIKLYEEGLDLSRSLKQQLSGFEKKIKELSSDDEQI